MDNFEREVNNAFNAGLKLLGNADSKVSLNDLEALTSFKNIVRMVLNGSLAISVVPQEQPPQPPAE